MFEALNLGKFAVLFSKLQYMCFRLMASLRFLLLLKGDFHYCIRIKEIVVLSHDILLPVFASCSALRFSHMLYVRSSEVLHCNAFYFNTK